MGEYSEIYDSEDIVCPFCRDREEGEADMFDDGEEEERCCKACGATFVFTVKVTLRFSSVSLEEFLKDKVRAYSSGLRHLKGQDPVNENALECTREALDVYQARLDGLLAAAAKDGTTEVGEENLTTENAESTEGGIG